MQFSPPQCLKISTVISNIYLVHFIFFFEFLFSPGSGIGVALNHYGLSMVYVTCCSFYYRRAPPFFYLFIKCLIYSAPIKSHSTLVVRSLVHLSCRPPKLSFPPMKMELIGASQHGLNRTSGSYSVHISISSSSSCP